MQDHKFQKNLSQIRNQKPNLSKSLKETDEALQEMEKSNTEIDRFYQKNFDKKWGLIAKLTNKTMYKQVQEVKQELIQESGKMRLNFYKTLLDSRLEALREKCNAGLKCIKSYYRQQVASFMMAKMEELSFEVKDRQISFMEMMKEKYTYGETLDKYPSMQQRYMNNVFIEEERYLRFLDKLLVNFENIVDEEIKKYN